jgi:hypothetical protein
MGLYCSKVATVDTLSESEKEALVRRVVLDLTAQNFLETGVYQSTFNHFYFAEKQVKIPVYPFLKLALERLHVTKPYVILKAPLYYSVSYVQPANAISVDNVSA